MAKKKLISQIQAWRNVSYLVAPKYIQRQQDFKLIVSSLHRISHFISDKGRRRTVILVGGAATANGGEPLNKSDACRTQPQKKLHNNCIYLSSSTDFFAPWWYEQSRYHHQSTFVDNMLTSSSSSKTGKTPKARPVDKNVAAGPAMTKAKEATPSPAQTTGAPAVLTQKNNIVQQTSLFFCSSILFRDRIR